MSESVIGAALPRKEDLRLLIGEGLYTGDVNAPGMLHMAVLRSPHAHARILRVETSAAAALAGVHAVISAADLPPEMGVIPLYTDHPDLHGVTPYPLARERVRFVGEPVAVVVAVNRYVAEDALDLIQAEYERLPAVTEPREALTTEAVLIHPELGTNLAGRVITSFGDVDTAFAKADHVARVEVAIRRCSPQSMEPRSVVAVPGRGRGERLTIWDSTQSAHLVQRIVSHMLGLSEGAVRVIAPDVGGAFGAKNRVYPEEILVAYLAEKLQKPVKWLSDRREDMISTYQERGQILEGELALRRDGEILGVRARIHHDQGAYTPFGLVVPTNTVAAIPGAYRVPTFACELLVAYTNKPGVAPYRGAGRPQGNFLMERLLDRAARDLGLDRIAIRMRNLITPAEQPYTVGGIRSRDGREIVYDGGDYPGALTRVLEHVDLDAFRTEQARLRAEGRYIGLGASNYVKMSGWGPYETATVRADGSGHVTVFSGCTSQGQGQETTLAQVCAQRLGVPISAVRVVLGDTLPLPYGVGTGASRSAMAAGNAVSLASLTLRKRAIQLAAVMLEAAPEEVDLQDGSFTVAGDPGRTLTLAELAHASTYPNLRGRSLPQELLCPPHGEPGLQATEVYRPPLSYPHGAHAAVVEVDLATGILQILRYVILHDCGKRLNPLIVDGQSHGAAVQGLGNALFEEVVYDAYGQPLGTSYADYLLPTAQDVPRFELLHSETPADNPEGVKGAGEGDIMPVSAVICSAVEDALSHLGIFVSETPLTPDRLQRLIAHASEVPA